MPTEPFPRLKRFVEHTIEMPIAALKVGRDTASELRAALAATLEAGNGVAHVLDDKGRVTVHSSRRACPNCGRGFAEPDPRLLSFNSPQGWCLHCHGTGTHAADFSEEQTGEESQWLATDAATASPCPACHGRAPQSDRAPPATRRALDQRTDHAHRRCAREILRRPAPGSRAAAIALDAMAEIRSRLQFLARVGLGYLSLDRAAPTLSGGEAQRIRLAAQLGSNLQGVCYILDEPTIGLHPRDNAVLLKALDMLAGARNTLVVVEHDEDTIRHADHIIDLGPGAGVRGGELIAAGTAAAAAAQPAVGHRTHAGRTPAPCAHAAKGRHPQPRRPCNFRA